METLMTILTYTNISDQWLNQKIKKQSPNYDCCCQLNKTEYT